MLMLHEAILPLPVKRRDHHCRLFFSLPDRVQILFSDDDENDFKKNIIITEQLRS